MTIPDYIVVLAAGPRCLSQGIEHVEPCPKCRSTNIKYARGRNGLRCECMNCRKCAKNPSDKMLGPSASNDIKGSTAVETRHLRRDEAYRLWNAKAICVRALRKKAGEDRG